MSRLSEDVNGTEFGAEDLCTEDDGPSPLDNVFQEASPAVAVAKLMAVLWLIFPAVVLLQSVVFGGILAGIEEWSFREGFFFVGAMLSSSSGQLVNVVPSSDGGRMFTILSGAWGLGLFALMSALMAAPIAAPLIRFLRLGSNQNEREEVGEGEQDPWALRKAAIKMALLILIGLPGMAFLVTVVIGGLLAAAEGWAFTDGYKYMGGVISGSRYTLIEETPSTRFGRFLTVLGACWATGIFAFFLAAIGAPFAAPLLGAVLLEGGTSPEEEKGQRGRAVNCEPRQ